MYREISFPDVDGCWLGADFYVSWRGIVIIHITSKLKVVQKIFGTGPFVWTKELIWQAESCKALTGFLGLRFLITVDQAFNTLMTLISASSQLQFAFTIAIPKLLAVRRNYYQINQEGPEYILHHKVLPFATQRALRTRGGPVVFLKIWTLMFWWICILHYPVSKIFISISHQAKPTRAHGNWTSQQENRRQRTLKRVKCAYFLDLVLWREKNTQIIHLDQAYLNWFYRCDPGKGTAKRRCLRFFFSRSCLSIFLYAALFYTQDLQILPSNEIIMMEMSSWYRLRSPCGISSKSWNSMPAIKRKPNVNIIWLSWIKVNDFFFLCFSYVNTYQLSLLHEIALPQWDVEQGLLQVATRWKAQPRKQLLHS